MSAFVVGGQHIQYLVEARLRFNRLSGSERICSWEGEVFCFELTGYPHHHSCFNRWYRMTHISPSLLGQILWEENIKSVQYRYGRASRDNLPGSIGESFEYEHVPMRRQGRFSPVQVIKACHCYEYQSCEHPGWRRSLAAAFINELMRNAHHGLPGFEEALWEIEGP